MGTKSNTSGNRNAVKKPGNHWSQGLLTAIKDPALVIFEDDLVAAIKDLYPKANHHFLVCCKEDVPTIKSVELKHLKLLKHMHSVAQKLCLEHKNRNFLIGYHSVPSMTRLHLHVISDDFDSPYLKTKKHWNSFTTKFFLKSDEVIRELETKGKITFRPIGESKKLIEQSLKCHKCDYMPKHMPDLKHHLKTHVDTC